MENQYHTGLSGRIADVFIRSKLTVLLMLVFMAIGIYSTMLIPREEEPQIQIPMADLFISYPGANPREVESRVVQPLEKMISNIKGVEYVYSTSMNGQAMLIVQYYVGEDIERSIVKLYDELNKHADKMPKGVGMPLIKTRSIDDVPMMSLTLWSERMDDYEILQVGQEFASELKKISDVANIQLIGGRERTLVVMLDKDKLRAQGLDMAGVARHIRMNNVQVQAGSIVTGDVEFPVEAGNFLSSREEVESLIIGTNGGRPVYLKQVARVSDGPHRPVDYVHFGYGKASVEDRKQFPSAYPAVTLAISKKKGSDAMSIAERVRERTGELKKTLLTEDLQISETRNYGETASEKVSELLLHLGIAILAVTLLVMLAMGWRGGLVVFLSVPTTFALTLFAYYFMDYTLNRITLFALVFVVGIVVDDSIIIAENMHRHFKNRKLPFHQAALFAINEVGNPTILATFTVIAAILPMAFVSGLMGPYMSPMPVGASLAMLFSLIIALTITPYLGYVFLRERDGSHSATDPHGADMKQDRIYRLYQRFLLPLLNDRKKRWLFLGTTAGVLVLSLLAFAFKLVAVKMLPFDNKNEFQVVIDMPEGTTLERTAAVAAELSQYLADQDEVISYQAYAGTASPITFNGLVRHYDIRSGSHQADIQVNLTHKDSRREQSHDLAKSYRPGLQAIAERYGANVKVVEVPPGPPVLSTLVAEIYGDDYDGQIAIAEQVSELMRNTPDVVDVDWYVEEPQRKITFAVDREKAMKHGVAPAQIVENIQLALSEQAVSTLYDPKSVQPVGIVLNIPDEQKSGAENLRNIPVVSQNGKVYPAGDLAELQEVRQDVNIYRKNQKRVAYVVADMAGALESPVYAILDMSKKLGDIELPKGYELKELYNGQPTDERQFTLKWDGEWQITYDVFRDLGIAFAVVILIIYLLIVGWFQHFKVPVVMMTAIPLSLIGIVIGHWIMDAYFTATSMIGFIALAGVMVRNSVLLIDFVNIRLRDGLPLKEAILEAGAVRTTPILLTAGAVAIGAVVILFDPIFQGLAISLIGGTVASTVLTLFVVPVLYFQSERRHFRN
ncbi:MAG: efflux RND transporter permease subunit [Saprospiraceae bacterium]|jgi:multidrug efflux pump subunit AcrB|nr:efflux RND transporter permease subunit [Saprospiraceae bacterium]